MTKRLFSVVAFLACTAHAAEWQPLPPLPAPNGGFLSGVRNGKIVIIGGTNWESGKKNWLSAIHEFDPVAGKWTKLRELSRPLAYGTNLQNDTAFAYLGGTDGTQSLKTLSVTEGEKTSVQLPALPASVILAAGGTVNGKHVLVGGTDDAANIAGVQRSVHAVEWINGSWQVTKLADYPGKPFAVAASAVAGSELFSFGGMNYDAVSKTPINSSEAYAFSPAKNTWRKLQPLAIPNRGLTAIALDDQHIYLAGGYTTDFTADAVIYDVSSNTYAKAKPLPYAAMVGLIKLDSFIYCLGGEDKQKSRTDKFFRIPAADLK